MDNEQELTSEELPLEGVGARLRRAREEHKYSLEQVAEETRIPLRHLKVIEQGDFGALPARTYAVGFSRTYARLVGLDEHAVAEEVRGELNMIEQDERAPAGMEPGDPAKLPSSGLAWAGAGAALMLAIGSFTFYSTFYGSGADPASLVEPEITLAQQDGGAALGDGTTGPTAGSLTQADNDGQVVFTALEDGVWVKFYDAAGDRLFEKQMASGERFEIPSDAEGPQIWTGRPDAFAITIDGRSVPKLAEDDFIMRDVAISADALLARADQAGQPANPTVAPGNSNP